MRTVKITIEVEVPDDCDRVAVDRYGRSIGFHENCFPVYSVHTNEWYCRFGSGYTRTLRISNWKETLKKVDDEV